MRSLPVIVPSPPSALTSAEGEAPFEATLTLKVEIVPLIVSDGLLVNALCSCWAFRSLAFIVMLSASGAVSDAPDLTSPFITTVPPNIPALRSSIESVPLFSLNARLAFASFHRSCVIDLALMVKSASKDFIQAVLIGADDQRAPLLGAEADCPPAPPVAPDLAASKTRSPKLSAPETDGFSLMAIFRLPVTELPPKEPLMSASVYWVLVQLTVLEKSSGPRKLGGALKPG